MELSYQHANPHTGRESYLLRFHEDLPDQTTCILVDAGDGVDDLLADDEYLSAILLTHAHLDHYQTLGANLRDNAPIYATPETVATLRTILDNGGEQIDLAQPGAIQDALEPITEWTSITSETRVHPVPAGHTRVRAASSSSVPTTATILICSRPATSRRDAQRAIPASCPTSPSISM